jgi:hypothetical protein
MPPTAGGHRRGVRSASISRSPLRARAPGAGYGETARGNLVFTYRGTKRG